MLSRLFCLDDKAFYRRIWAIALPIALQNFINFGVSMMDTLMVGKLGEIQLSASSAANQMSFMFMILSFGIANGCAVLSSQHWGRGNRDQIGLIMAVMYRIVILLSVAFTLLGVLAPEFVLRLFIPDPLVIAQGVIYLRIVAWSFLFTGITNSTIGILRSMGTVKISLVVYSVSLVVNTILNYCLIFGKFGFPEMGIAGAALATLISRGAECAIVVIYLFKFEKKLALKFKDLLRVEKSIVRDTVKYSLPVMLNELMWSSGSLLVSSIIGHMGREVLAASSICMVLFQLSQAAIFGLSNSAATIIGNTVGGGEYPVARRRANAFIAISVVMGLAAASLMFVARFPLIGFYESSLSPLAMSYAYEISLVACGMAIVQTMSMIMMMGVLRGGGDTRFVMVIDVIFMWTICIPLGAVAGLILHLPVPLVYMILKSEDIFKATIASVRIIKGKWLKDVTR